MILDSTKSVKN